MTDHEDDLVRRGDVLAKLRGSKETCQCYEKNVVQMTKYLPAADVGGNLVEGLVAMLRSRATHGKLKYGTTMDRADLTPDAWAQHLLEELLDAANYVQALRRDMSKLRADEDVPLWRDQIISAREARDKADEAVRELQTRVETAEKALSAEREAFRGFAGCLPSEDQLAASRSTILAASPATLGTVKHCALGILADLETLCGVLRLAAAAKAE